MTESSGNPGAAAAAADVAVALLGGLAAVLACTGPYRDIVAGVALSLGWEHALFATAAIAAIRHAALPRPSWLASVRRWHERIVRRPALADAALAFWLTRPAIVVVGLLATVTIGLSPDAPGLLSSRDPWRDLPARWDAQWYAGLAAHGYEWQRSFDPQQNLAFFPAYPLMIRGVGWATGAFRTSVPDHRRIALLTWCGLFVSLAAFFGAAWYFAALSRELMDEPRARAALLLLAAYPFALFFSAAYTESVFLLTAVATWFHFRRGDTLATVGWGLLAGLTRPNGCFLSIPLALLALGVRDAGGRTRSVSLKRLTLASMPGVGMLLFTAYLHQITGIWFAWWRTQAAWGRVVGGGSPLPALSDIGSAGIAAFAVSHPYDLLNALGLLFVLVLVLPVWRLSPAWAAFVLVNVMVPLAAGGLLSMGRLTSTLFPLFLAAALALPAGAAVLLASGFAIAQGLLAALFYTWRAVY